MEVPDRLIGEILEGYEAQRALLDRLMLLVDSGKAEQVASELSALESLQEASQEKDLRLRQLLSESPELIQTPGVQTYLRRLADMKERFDALIGRMQSASNFVAQEISQLRGSKAAVGGYKSRTDHRGGRIKGSY